MKKRYVVSKPKLSEALIEIETFENKMEEFIKRFPGFKHSSNITREGDKWNAEVKIVKDE